MVDIENGGSKNRAETYRDAYAEENICLSLLCEVQREHCLGADALRYIGIEQEQLNAAYLDLNL